MKKAIKKETETRVKTIEAAREEFQKLLEEGWEKTSIIYSYLLINKLLINSARLFKKFIFISRIK